MSAPTQTRPTMPGRDLTGREGVNLLPASVRSARGLRRLRAMLAVGLAVLLVVLGAGFGVLLMFDAQARDELDLARAETDRLQLELQRYSEVADVQAAIGQAESARQIAMGTEILWVDLIRRIEAVTPPGTTITSFSAQGVAPAEGSSFTAPDLLANPGVATISFTIHSPTLPDTAAWLEALNGIPGFMDASFTSASLTDGTPEEGIAELYTVASTVQVNVIALSGAHVETNTADGGDGS